MDGFVGRRILLLQGPMGPFFARLARDLKSAGAAEVWKVNFNGGDCFFSPKRGAIAFRGSLEEWPKFFENILVERKIDVVFLFGDCRPIHRQVRRISHKLDVALGVFEEGYVRPDYITLEEFGVNGFSTLPSHPDFYLENSFERVKPPLQVGKTFMRTALWAILYYAASVFTKPAFRHYRHHRPLTAMEALPWLKSFWRKCYYAVMERGISADLTADLSGKYFLVPLQVYNDGQIHVHSNFKSVKEFIRYVIESFTENAPADTYLIFKHHPLDRGYNDYGRFINALAKSYGVHSRVLYIHDLYLPTLLDHARGVVVINSTVGLSAIHHGTPVKACGRAIYDMEGLTFQGHLDDFWDAAPVMTPNKDLYINFRNYIITHSQINGNYYKKISGTQLNTGIYWSNIQTKVRAKTLSKAPAFPKIRLNLFSRALALKGFETFFRR